VFFSTLQFEAAHFSKHGDRRQQAADRGMAVPFIVQFVK
jgi:hypothetical protein